jgi:PAS domain S-box-containing protein
MKKPQNTMDAFPNQGYLRRLIEANQDPIFVTDKKGIIIDLNTASCTLIGSSLENLINGNIFELFTNREKVNNLFSSILEKETLVDEPLTLIAADGSLIDILFNGSLYRDEHLTIMGTILAIRPRMEKKKKIENLIGFLDSVPDAIVIINKAGKIKLVNEQTLQLFGYMENELIEKELEMLIPEKYRTLHLTHREHYLKLPITRQMGERNNLYGLHKNGVEFPVDIILSQLETDEGLLVSAAIRDVSKQKQASQYARSLIEASLDPLVTISADGKIMDVNEASVIITGVSRNELIGTDFSHYFTEPTMASQAYEEVFERGFVSDYPLTIKSKNGKFVHVLYNASLYKDNTGKVLGVFAAARDITKQRQSSHYARSLIEATLDPLVTINTIGKITDINDAMLKATDQTREQLIGTDFKSYFIESEKADQVYKDVFKNGIIQNIPLTIIDGVLTDVLLNGSVYKDELGNIMGAVVVARDITELKRIEKELIEAKVTAELSTLIAEDAKIKAEKATGIAEEAVKSKQQFLSNMSHEIRTPMNAIIGFTKVVLKTELNDKQKEYLNAIKLSGDALIVLINDILDLAKVDAGKMAFEASPFNLKTSILDMLNLFEARILEKNLLLVIDYDDSIPHVLLGDSMRLHQIILNLVSNALKFTSHGTITVSTKLKTESDEKVEIEFSVKDTGIGISENHLDKIFDNFQQATSGTSRLYGGTGLGLAIVKQLVEYQKGSVRVDSKLGQGSTFSFVLPLLKTDKSSTIDESIFGENFNTLNIKVLVVEDIALNQLLMKTILDDFGFERDIAANGLIAIEKLRHNFYDIILMDLQMPEMNGFEATEYIRKTMNMDIPIIALTADVTTVDLEKCKAVGMNDYLAKPLDEKLLYSKIVALIKQRNIQNKNKINISTIPGNLKTKFTNLNYIKQLTKSDESLMAEMIALYLEQTPELIRVMNHSLATRNWQTLYDAVHKMIPSFIIMGISTEFENMAKTVQEFASTQKSETGISELIKQLDNICTQACLELKLDLIEIENRKS